MHQKGRDLGGGPRGGYMGGWRRWPKRLGAVTVGAKVCPVPWWHCVAHFTVWSSRCGRCDGKQGRRTMYSCKHCHRLFHGDCRPQGDSMNGFACAECEADSVDNIEPYLQYDSGADSEAVEGPEVAEIKAEEGPKSTDGGRSDGPEEYNLDFDEACLNMDSDFESVDLVAEAREDEDKEEEERGDSVAAHGDIGDCAMFVDGDISDCAVSFKDEVIDVDWDWAFGT